MNRNTTHRRRVLSPAFLWTPLAFCMTFVHALPAFGEGFRILDQSAAATAQGGAFAAQADDPSAVHFNPAAMTNLPGLQTTIGTLLVNGQIDFTPTTGAPVEGDFGGTVANPPPSSLFVTARFANPGLASLDAVALGLGVYAPFGNLTNYPRDSSIAPVLTRSASPILDVTPTLAFRVNPAFALGIGLDLYTFSGLFGEGHVEVQRTGADLAGIGFPASADETIELHGDDTALGYHASLLWTPLRNAREQPLVNVAVVYRSQTTLRLKGQLQNRDRGIAVDAAANLPLPQVITTGLAVWPLRDARREWKVEVDVDYADWTSFKNLDVNLSNAPIDPGTGTIIMPSVTLPNPRNWQSAYVIMAGTEYKWVEPAWLPHWDVAVRGGYVFADSPVPERTFRPDVPGANSHSYSVGVGWLCRRGGAFLGLIPCGTSEPGGVDVSGIGLDVAWQGIFYQSRGISNNDDPLARVNGVWDTTIHVGSLNLRVNFDVPGLS